MNKPSNFFDALDKTLEIRNWTIDVQVQNLIDEILWIDANYDNIDALRNYLLKCANFNNAVANVEYAHQLNSYTDSYIQNLVEERANILYGRILTTKNSKLDNKPIKLIVQELKAFNQ